jgi:aryl sulfotransferase
VTESRRRYRSADEDSARWDGFELRDGDIVITARSKHGTTWMQMISALLVFGEPDLPAPLATLSPWLDWRIEPIGKVRSRLDAQQHRRIIKTHTPLDGLPIDARAQYLVVARHPLDAAVSLYHQGANLDRERISELTGVPPAHGGRPPLGEWLTAWIDHDADPLHELDSLPGVMWHVGDAWIRSAESNIELVHYRDLEADLDGSMRHIADFLDVDVDPARWPTLVQAAEFAEMRQRADELAPNRLGTLREPSRFFRFGRSGGGREVLSDDELRRYTERVQTLIPFDPADDFLEWLHRE